MRTCMETQKLQGSYDFSRCSNEFDKSFRVFAEPSWGNVAIVAFAPVAIACLLAYIVVWLTRSGSSGNRNNHDDQDPQPRSPRRHQR